MSLNAQLTTEAARSSPHTPAAVTSHAARLMGPYDASRKLRLVIALARPKVEEERKLLEALYTEGSPEFHKFLTAKEWNARFAPSAEAEQAVVDWVTSQGMTVTHRYPNRLLVDVEAPVATIQKALSTNINHYQFKGTTVFSNDRDPSIPAQLSGIVSSVMGLNSIEVMHPHSKLAQVRIHPDYAEGPATARAGAGRANGSAAKLAAARAAKTREGITPDLLSGRYDPIDIYGSNAYNFDGLQHLKHCCNPDHIPGGTPPETSIAIATVGAQKLSDMEGFHAQFPYLAYNINYINIDGTPACCDGEGTMDAEWATAMANSFGSTDDTAHVWVYQGVNTQVSTFVDEFNHMLTDGHARVMSTSWGCGEGVCSDTVATQENNVLAAMAAQGWTLIADADDKGSAADCKHALVEFPASSPHVIAAGGTTLSLSSQSTYTSEVAWTGGTSPGSCAANDGGGGGGMSGKFPSPVYQSFLGFPGRTLPDISLNASWPQVIYFQGQIQGGSGTSIVAPELAGFFAQENAYLLYLQDQVGIRCFGNQACAPIGNANYPIYLEQMHAPAYAPHYPFYDITSGCATNDATAAFNLPFYCAAPGYDLATGLGSANMLQLAWAINYGAAGDFGPPQATFSGASANTWYNAPRQLNVQFTDTTLSVRQPTGVAGYSLAWDRDPSPESLSKSTPGSGDAFYSGPAVANSNQGSLDISQNGQGCHFAMARAWDNTGTPSGLLSYGPVCYDTIAPVTTAVLSGTQRSDGVYTSAVKVTLIPTDAGSGPQGTFYSLTGRSYLLYQRPIKLPVSGTYTLTYYSSDVAGNAETLHSRTFTIKIKTTTQLRASKTSSTFGDKVTFTATVSGGGSSLNGSVTFKDGATTLGQVNLNSGKATFSTKALHVGTHTITAVYHGNDQSSTSGPLKVTVHKSGTTAALATVTASLR